MNTPFRFPSLPALLAAAALLTLSLVQAEPEPPLKPIFTGEDLSGWVVPDNNIWFSAKDGILTLQSGPEKKGKDIWTEQHYTDFIIEFDFLFGEGTVDSGIFMREAHDQIQIGISGSLKRDMTGSPYIPKKGYPQEAEGVAKLLKLEDWNTMKIKAEGPVYTVWLNGKKVNTYTSETAAETGPIGIQLHGNKDMAIQYRNIRAAAL